jgi:hypothetical protein
MAKFKTLKIKDKKFVFTAYGNDKLKNPACCVFDHFPQDDEEFFIGDRKSLHEMFKGADAATEKGRQEFIDGFIKQFVKNVQNGRLDHAAFLRECVSEFCDFEYNGKNIKTADDFLKLPEDAVKHISNELYIYAKREDEFSMGE